MKVKICGLTRLCDVDFVNQAQPDYVGFVFAKSKRQVTYEQAKKLKEELCKDILAVGVFVDADVDFINRLILDGIIDMAQLHGQESDEDINRIKAPTIKAVRIGEETNRPADFLLFDSPIGGSGQCFDWSALPKTEKPFFLAGGINIENVNQGMAQKPFGIDVSSGVETNGYKDKEKIIELVRSVRNGER